MTFRNRPSPERLASDCASLDAIASRRPSATTDEIPVLAPVRAAVASGRSSTPASFRSARVRRSAGRLGRARLAWQYVPTRGTFGRHELPSVADPNPRRRSRPGAVSAVLDRSDESGDSLQSSRRSVRSRSVDGRAARMRRSNRLPSSSPHSDGSPRPRRHVEDATATESTSTRPTSPEDVANSTTRERSIVDTGLELIASVDVPPHRMDSCRVPSELTSAACSRFRPKREISSSSAAASMARERSETKDDVSAKRPDR